MDKLMAGLIVFAGVIGIMFGICALLTVPFWLLWNWLCPVFGLPILSFFQSFGVLILSNMLFKSSSIDWNKK